MLPKNGEWQGQGQGREVIRYQSKDASRELLDEYLEGVISGVAHATEGPQGENVGCVILEAPRTHLLTFLCFRAETNSCHFGWNLTKAGGFLEIWASVTEHTLTSSRPARLHVTIPQKHPSSASTGAGEDDFAPGPSRTSPSVLESPVLWPLLTIVASSRTFSGAYCNQPKCYLAVVTFMSTLSTSRTLHRGDPAMTRTS